MIIEIEVDLLYSCNKSSKNEESAITERLNEGATLLDLLKRLSSKYRSLESILNHGQGTAQELVVLLNGRNPPNGLLTRLNDGDKVSIIPIIAGG